jgi:hypothetical protein
MQKSLRSLLLFAIGAFVVYGQNQDSGHWPISLGLKAGIPVTNMFSSGSSSLFEGQSIPYSSYTSATPRYEFGVSAEFHLPLHLRFEVDGLYKRGGFDNSFVSSDRTPGYMRTSFNQWEIPGLFKYNFSLGHFRPFVDFGASYRHISTINQRNFSSSSVVYSDNSMALANRNSFGGVAGFGITFKKGPFEFTPEARYTRWANSAFSADGLKSSKDQGDVLLGISF